MTGAGIVKEKRLLPYRLDAIIVVIIISTGHLTHRFISSI
jgi:hypothetical protein